MYIVMLLCLPILMHKLVQTQQSKTLIQASMAAKASTSTSKKEKTKKNTKPIEDDEESIDALPWNSSLPDDFDPFDTTSTTNNLHGGFISLEEINEVEYDLSVAPESKKRDRTVFDEASVRLAEEKAKRNKRKKEKKRKKKEIEKREREREAKVERILDLKEKKGKKDKEQLQVLWQELLQETKGKNAKEKLQELLNEKKGAKVKKNNGETSDDSKSSAISSQELKISDEAVEDESQFYAWNDLRLHPLLMKAIQTLGFKEPTPIQKACIPAAAHQGKDVIGAAETGSGKTLAFGLPILQRLLEEREKAAKSEGNTMKESDKESPLRALIITPTRELSIQVADHLKKVARFTSIGVVPIVGGMSSEKQERLLNSRPEIVVGTPGRLWELMSGGGNHLSELHSLSFFVLDEADRMVENGHFKELQSIIDLLPMSINSVKAHQRSTQDCVTILNLQQKKRQTFVFSATIALSADFRKKLKRGSHDTKNSMKEGTISCLETLSGRAGMRADAAIIDLTNTSILANKLEESFVECREEDKDAYLYYLLSVHGQCRTIVFCTSISSLRHISSLLRILGVNASTLNAQMQQRARIKAVDRFRENEHSVLVATDVAARGLDIPGVRTVIHYQLPHSAEVYVHRSGRTARASAEGCSIALISPNDKSKFASLCRSFSKDSYQRFPIDSLYMPEVMKRLSLARQIDKMTLKDSKENAKKSMVERTAESLGLILDDYDSEEERVNKHKQKKKAELHLMQLKQNLNLLLSRPLQPKTLSHRFLAGSGVSPLLQNQFEEIARPKEDKDSLVENKRRKLVVIGQDCTDPLEALRNAKNEGRVDVKEKVDNRRSMENLKRKRKQEKKLLRDKRRKQRKEMKRLNENREENSEGNSEDISEDNCE